MPRTGLASFGEAYGCGPLNDRSGFSFEPHKADGRICGEGGTRSLRRHAREACGCARNLTGQAAGGSRAALLILAPIPLAAGVSRVLLGGNGSRV